METLTAITKALADENRLRIIMMLADQESCVCQVVEVLGFAPSTVSKHLSILRQAGLISYKKNGRWVYYRLPDNPSPEAADAIDFEVRHLQDDPKILEDRSHGRVICSQDPEALTKEQRQRTHM